MTATLYGSRPGTPGRARDWAEIQERMLVPLYETVYDRLEVGAGTRLLGLGCGTGLALLLASARGAAVTGHDPDGERLALARERVGVRERDRRPGSRTRLLAGDLRAEVLAQGLPTADRGVGGRPEGARIGSGRPPAAPAAPTGQWTREQTGERTGERARGRAGERTGGRPARLGAQPAAPPAAAPAERPREGERERDCRRAGRGTGYDVITAFEPAAPAGELGGALAAASSVARHGGAVVLAGWGPPERCATSRVLKVATRLAEPRSGLSPALRLSGRDDLEDLARTAGLRPDGSGRVSCPFGYPDLPSAVRGLLSTGLFDAAVAATDPHQVDKEVAEALHPYRRPDGTVRMENVFRYLIARA